MNVDYTGGIKFLGIQITDTLKWHSHVQLLAGKLCKVAFMIKSLKEVLSPNLIRNVHFTVKKYLALWPLNFDLAKKKINCCAIKNDLDLSPFTHDNTFLLSKTRPWPWPMIFDISPRQKLLRIIHYWCEAFWRGENAIS